MKLIGWIAVLCMVAVGAVHAFFVVQYDTLTPCEAAVKRMRADAEASGDVIRGSVAAALDAMDLEQDAFRDGNVLDCYRVALFGSDPPPRQ